MEWVEVGLAFEYMSLGWI